jgi:hypothetical protein
MYFCRLPSIEELKNSTLSGCEIIIAKSEIKEILKNIEVVKKLLLMSLFFFFVGRMAGETVYNNNKYIFVTNKAQTIPIGKLIKKFP